MGNENTNWEQSVTAVVIKENKVLLARHTYGGGYPVVSREEYAGSSFKGIVSSYFNNSYLNAVSALVKDEKISLDELKDLINQIENGK